MPSSSDGVVTATADTATASVLLTVNFTVAGSPISGTAATTVYAITVTEQTTGRGVRGLTLASAPGGAVTGIDHEAPFGVGLSYVATAYDVSGNLLATSTAAAVTLLLPAFGSGMWLKSLTTPTMSVQPIPAAAPQWDADIAQGVLQVINRPDPIVVQDVRQYPSTTITVYTPTAADELALTNLLASPGPYLAQFPGLGAVDRYVTVGKYSVAGVGSSPDPTRTWSLPMQSVGRPDPYGWAVAIPGKTYADSSAAMPLYSNRTGTYLSRSS